MDRYKTISFIISIYKNLLKTLFFQSRNGILVNVSLSQIKDIMASKIFAKTQNFVLAFLIIFSFSGCDQVSNFTESFKEYFGPKEKPAQQAVAVSTPAPTPQTQVNTDKPLAPNELARVGNWSITVEEFNARLAQLKEVVPEYDVDDPQAKALILEELIRQQLLVEYAEDSGLSKRKDIVDAVEEFRRTLLVREVAVQLTENVEASELEARQYYDQNKEALIEPEELRVREIVVDTQQGAKDILIELLKGADFSQIAQERSIGKTAAQGGDLGFISEAPFEQMANTLSTLNIGDISSVFSGPQGFYIVKIEEKRGGEQKDFAEIKDEIKTGLTLLKQQQAILGKIEAAQKKSPVKVNEGLLTK